MSEKKTVFICDFCGSDRVQVKAWVHPNKNNKVIDWVNEGDNNPEDKWCDDCHLHTTTSTIEVDKKAKVIGFQVEDQFSKHEMHPATFTSFCIYNLHQADEMIKQDENKWQIKAIWTGDIKEPTFMFKGKNPYNF